MKKINASMIQNAIQAMVNKGEITCMGENMIYHSKSGAYNVGTEDDLFAVWDRISAYRNRDNG